MNIKPFAESDLTMLAVVQPPGWPDLSPTYRYYLCTPCCKPIAAVEGGLLVGVGSGISLGSTGWLGHIIVHPEHRRRGIGTAIVDHLVGHLHALGIATVSLIATTEGRPLYAGMGFVEHCEYSFYDRQPDSSAPLRGGGAVDGPDVNSTIVPLAPDDLDSVLGIDAETSGESRWPILEGRLDGAVVIKDDGRVVGYYAPGVGEGVVICVGRAAGASLLAQRPIGQRNVAPADNVAVRDWYSARGMTEKFRAVRMVLGPPLTWRPENVYSRIGGNLG
jgi:GNAT superfamily N-acetyltransferase